MSPSGSVGGLLVGLRLLELLPAYLLGVGQPRLVPARQPGYWGEHVGTSQGFSNRSTRWLDTLVSMTL